jgi:hypothetical protein
MYNPGKHNNSSSTCISVVIIATVPSHLWGFITDIIMMRIFNGNMEHSILVINATD